MLAHRREPLRGRDAGSNHPIAEFPCHRECLRPICRDIKWNLVIEVDETMLAMEKPDLSFQPLGAIERLAAEQVVNDTYFFAEHFLAYRRQPHHPPPGMPSSEPEDRAPRSELIDGCDGVDRYRRDAIGSNRDAGTQLDTL